MNARDRVVLSASKFNGDPEQSRIELQAALDGLQKPNVYEVRVISIHLAPSEFQRQVQAALNDLYSLGFVVRFTDAAHDKYVIAATVEPHEYEELISDWKDTKAALEEALAAFER